MKILLLASTCTLFRLECSGQSDSILMNAFEQIFRIENFDSSYYFHKYAPPLTFFVVENDAVKDLFGNSNHIGLTTGVTVVSAIRPDLFVHGIDYYLRLEAIVFEDRKLCFVLIQIKAMGPNERLILKRRFTFENGALYQELLKI